jgi:hypothetical protein
MDGQQYVVPAFPFLAPLLDRMTTDDVAIRFNAGEALSFCRFIQKTLTSNELDKELPPEPRSEKPPGRWESLPDHFVAMWSIKGPGWVRIICFFFANSDNVRWKQIKVQKPSLLPISI